MRWIALVFILFLTIPAQAQRRVPTVPTQVVQPIETPQRILLQQELQTLITGVASLESRIQGLTGDYRTMQAIQQDIAALRARMMRLLRFAPPVLVLRPDRPQPRPHTHADPAPPQAPPEEPLPMAPDTFQLLEKEIGSQSFADGRLSVVRTAARNNYFNVEQVIALLGAFRFSEGKLNAVRALHPRVLDRENEFRLYDAFRFSSDKEALKTILESH